MKGQDGARLQVAGVMTQYPALSHLDVSGNYNFGSEGTESLAGVLV